MQHITVIGSGTMGNGIAHVFAQNGYQVNLVDVIFDKFNPIAFSYQYQFLFFAKMPGFVKVMIVDSSM